jgi:hypothetical protein
VSPHPLRATLVRSTAPLAGLLLLLPAVVYVASWAGWFASDSGWSRQWAPRTRRRGRRPVVPDALRSLWHYHAEVLRFHSGLSDPHPVPELARPAGSCLARPVSYYYPQGISTGDYGCEAASCSREVLAIGTPALWWVAVPVLRGAGLPVAPPGATGAPGRSSSWR